MTNANQKPKGVIARDTMIHRMPKFGGIDIAELVLIVASTAISAGIFFLAVGIAGAAAVPSCILFIRSPSKVAAMGHFCTVSGVSPTINFPLCKTASISPII